MARTILYFYIFFYITCISTSVDIEPSRKSKQNPDSKEVNNTEKLKEDEKTLINIDTGNSNDRKSNLEKVNVKKSNISPGNVTASKISTENSTIKNNANAEIESGAVMRGVYVFVGITMLFIMYIAFKTYRRGNRKNVIIKKYGVRTRRSDLEMEPLPLDEDEEDETVFDLGNVNNR